MNFAEIKTRLHLAASVERLEQLNGRLQQCLQGLDEGDRIALLLIAEREVLGKRGHITTLKFGTNPYDNAPECIICQGKVSKDDYSFIAISRLEISQVWITFHIDCVAGELFEFDYDVLTGDYRSAIGPT